MNKATARNVQRTLAAHTAGLIDASTVARALTAEHRAAPTAKVQRELDALIATHCAAHVQRLPNGCLIARHG